MPLSALATVEHQLIMHCLQSREIVQLARCSRSLMHAADSPFAFRHAEPVRRPFPEPPQGSSIISPVRLCLQHAPFIVVWTLPRTDSAAELDAAVDALIAFLEAASSGRVHGLDAEDNITWIDEDQWERIFACRNVQQFRFLALPRPLDDRNVVSDELIEIISRLPLLSTLRIGDSSLVGEECALLKLCELPALTSFDSSAYSRPWPPTCLRSVARCRHLTSLGFSASNLNMEDDRLLSPLDSCPSLSSLRHLRIEWCSFRAEYLDDFFRVLSLMSQLHSLTLAFFNYLGLLVKEMPTVVARHPLPATLETICFQPALSEVRSKDLPLISRLLTAFPRLRFVVRIEPPSSCQDRQTHLRVGSFIRELFPRSSEFEGFQTAGRFRIDWRLPL